jgi:hypothetical protein
LNALLAKNKPEIFQPEAEHLLTHGTILSQTLRNAAADPLERKLTLTQAWKIFRRGSNQKA